MNTIDYSGSAFDFNEISFGDNWSKNVSSDFVINSSVSKVKFRCSYEYELASASGNTSATGYNGRIDINGFEKTGIINDIQIRYTTSGSASNVSILNSPSLYFTFYSDTDPLQANISVWVYINKIGSYIQLGSLLLNNDDSNIEFEHEISFGDF